MRQTAEMVAQMTSVERILEFTELEQEGPFESEPGDKPAATWPEKGSIEFQGVYLRYACGETGETGETESPPILKDVNITIEPGMKVGIVGRTGAGKSSLVSALLNLAKIEGDIYIDGVNTRKIGLNDLRSKISIIPQEPVLFSSTLRYNLDPFDRHDDASLYSALEDVELLEPQRPSRPTSALDRSVNEGGANFSAGERQLLCLARAILRKNKILVLDEATANVDPATDRLIQTTIRRKFNDCTVLTIAHRLNTIMDSDRVLVMDNGRVVEFHHPHILLTNNDGYLTKMLRQTGPAMTRRLGDISKQAYRPSRDIVGQ